MDSQCTFHFFSHNRCRKGPAVDTAGQLGGLVHVLVSPLTLASVRITLHLHSMLLLSLRLIKNDNELGKGQHVPFSVLLACSPLTLPPFPPHSLSVSPSLSLSLPHTVFLSLFSSCIERALDKLPKSPFSSMK